MSETQENYIKREVFDEIATHLEKSEITLITGSRQVGKTVILGQLKDFLTHAKGVRDNQILSYNLDIVQDWENFQSQTNFIKFLKDRSSDQKLYVFIDEAQRVEDAARFFKGVYDSRLNIKLILTGSSSLEIKAKLKESLAGRKMVFQVPPFTFTEFLRCRDEFLQKLLFSEKKINAIDEVKIINLYKEYITYGGYPKVVLSKSAIDKVNTLKEIYSSYVEKDAVGFMDVKNKTAFNRLLKLLAGQIGQLVNIGELAVNLSIDRQTVERYISALEETFILKKITPYFTNSRQEIIKSGKIYFMDLGIRNLVLENFSDIDERADKGAVLENAVFAGLTFILRNSLNKLHFWRTKQGAEVDFVIEKKGALLLVEVKFSVKKKKETVAVSLRNFIKKFKAAKAIVANLTAGGKIITVENASVHFVYPFELPREILKS